jgi:hypothetical protein
MVVVECEMELQPREAGVVVVHTPYVNNPTSPDWTVLLELVALPQCILVSRPLHIESRVESPGFVVYRPDPRGWADVVYAAKSHSAALALVEYLEYDVWNAPCYIGAPEAIGEWAIVESSPHGDRVIGAYPTQSMALRVAWQLSSLENTDATVAVVDISQEQGEQAPAPKELRDSGSPE